MMRAIFCIVIFTLIAPGINAQTNLTELLQQGMFEEQANHNLDAAISDYQALSTQFDKDRQLVATAIFRLGECYREEGETNQAAMEYRRILTEFPDQRTLATLSREDLAGMGAAASVAGNSAAPTVSGNASSEAALLASQISGIESLKPDPEEEARATLAIFPAQSSKLEDMVLQLPKLRDQEAWVKANPKATYYQMLQARGLVQAVGTEQTLADIIAGTPTNALTFSSDELNKQTSALEYEVNFVLGVQKARLKALQAAAKLQTAPETAQVPSPSNDEDQEIARIQQMIQNSPDLINAPGDKGFTPLENAAMKGQLKVAAFLLDHGADVNAGNSSALNLAANAGNRAMVEFLLSRGADINAKARTGETPLHTAASEGYKAVTEALLANKANVNARNDSGATPLQEAARNGHGQIVQMLLNAGADPNITDNYGGTPLSDSAGLGSTETVKALLAAKADPNAGTLDAPLLCAIDQQDLASAELLLQASADPNVDGLMHCPQGSYGSKWDGTYSAALRKAPALWLAIQKHDLPMVRLLLKYKANPDNSQISEPPAVIFWALSDTNILQALLNGGANPNIIRSDGRTPLSVAAENDLLESVKLLLAAKADPNGDLSDPPLAAAVFQNYPEIVRVLLQAGADPNGHAHADAYGRFGGPVIFRALSSTNILEQLLNAGADPNARDKGGNTVLNNAVLSLDELAARLLLDHGAKPNVAFPGGETPLHLMERVTSKNTVLGGNVPGEEQPAIAALIADLLRQHGALEVLPDWDHISVSRLSTKYSKWIFYKGTNDWNQFSLYDVLGAQYDLTRFRPYGEHNELSFPDFSRIIIHRPPVQGTNWTDLKVNLSGALDSGDCGADVPLKFGDVVEIPESDHILDEAWTGLTTNELLTLAKCLTRHLQVTVAGTTTNIAVGPQVVPLDFNQKIYWSTVGHDSTKAISPPTFVPKTQPLTLWPILENSQLLLSSSDLSQVLVKRRDPATGDVHQWTLDCSDPNSPPNFWLRDGDVIEVPEMR